MNIYIARHGEDIDNQKNLFNGRRNQPITDNGKIQAEKIADYFINHKIQIHKLFTSPLERAFDTAKIISTKLNLEPEIDPCLIERDIGDFSGLSVKDAMDIYQGDLFYVDNKPYFIDPPNGESFDSVKNRLTPFIKKLEENYFDSDNILVIGHGMVIKIFYSIIYNLDYQTAIANLPVKNGNLFLFNKEKPVEFLIRN